MTRLLALLAALALATTACGGDDGPDTAEPTADPAVTTTPTADGTTATDGTGTPADDLAGTTVTLMTHDSFNVSEDVIAGFEEDTGMTVEVLPAGDAGAMLNQAILSRDDPQADVLFGVDNTFLSRAFENDLFVPYRSPGLDTVDPRYVLDEQNRATPIDFGDVCLNYDKEFFEEQDLAVPQTLEELTEPAYEGMLVVENPATSSPGLAFLLATVERFGEDDWVAYWEQLRANGVTVSDGWEDAYYGQFSGGSAEGDKPLVVSYASSPPAEVFFADPQPDEAPTGVIVDSCFRQIEFAGILAGTENQAGAEALVDFMLTVEFQEDIPLNMFVFPVSEEAALPDVFVEHTTVPDNPIEMDFQRIAANRQDWIETWTDTVLR